MKITSDNLQNLRYKIYSQKRALRALHTAIMNKNARITNLEVELEEATRALNQRAALVSL